MGDVEVQAPSKLPLILAILAIIGVFIVMILAIVAFFFPRSSSTMGAYSRSQKITLASVVSGTPPSVNLDSFSNIPGTLFTATYNITATGGSSGGPLTVAPIMIDGSKISTNSNFGIFNTGNRSMSIFMSNFSNVPGFVEYTLTQYQALNFFVDENHNVYYSQIRMFPNYNTNNDNGTNVVVPIFNPPLSNGLYKFSVIEMPPTLNLILNQAFKTPNPAGNVILEPGNTIVLTDINKKLTSPSTLYVFSDTLSTTVDTYYFINNATAEEMDVVIFPPSITPDTIPADVTGYNTYIVKPETQLQLYFSGNKQVAPGPNGTK
jgi:hypothetical protein